MPRPRSISIFDIAYLAMLAANLLSPILLWSVLTTNVAAQAHLGADKAGVVQGVLIGGLVVLAVLGAAVVVVRRAAGSNVARWIAVVVLAYNLISTGMGVAQFGALDLPRAVALIGMVFNAVALATLFMPDARAWFARGGEDEMAV